MKVLAINGSNGFLGRQICKYFENKYHIIRINRNDYLLPPALLANKISSADIVINMAGARIPLVSTKRYRRIMYESRISTTSNLVNAIEILYKKSIIFISMSAVGIYDYANIHDENSDNFGTDFLSRLCIDWELAGRSELLPDSVTIRSGIVLSREGGFFKRIKLPFSLGMGVIIGNGTQPLPFIHLQDFLRAIDFVIDRHLTGIINFVAPTFCSNLGFSRTLSHELKRPLLFRFPSFLIKIFMGEQSSMFLEGQNVKPKKLMDNGFMFMFPDIERALTNLLNTDHS